MKINYMSDVHLEFGLLNHELEGEVMVLAGDITVKQRDVPWILEMAEHFEHVIYVLGNHEHYRQNLDNTLRKTREAIGDADNVHLLQNESVTIEGVTFHGTTLWTDMNKGDPLTYHATGGAMNDFKLIRADGGKSRFTPQRAHKEFNVAKVFLTGVIKPGDVVVTHMAPSYLSVHEKYKGDTKMNGAYASDLSDVMLDYEPALWFHGHVHYSFDYTIGNTRVLCNPRGYVGEELNPDFNLYATVEVKGE